MNREIKFRAWIKEQNRMEHCISVNPFYIGDCDRLRWKRDEVELMQYTGLKDKNGKEIFEGDIVEGQSICSDNFEYRGKVIFYIQNNVHGWNVEDVNGGAWEINQLATKISLDHITGEVIGNIFENPEAI